MPAKLVRPSIAYKTSLLEALREGYTHGVEKPRTEEDIQEIEDNFDDFIANASKVDAEGQIKCPDGNVYDRVPSTSYWLVLDDTFIGGIAVRHHLNDFLIQYGGHIGYGVRPSFRKQGYGTLMLRLCLSEARKLVDDRVLITCSDSNTGSRKIIESNGGILENVAHYDWMEGGTMRFWIEF